MSLAANIPADLAAALGALIRRYYSVADHSFDYGGAAVSSEYQALKQVTARLTEFDPGKASRVDTACAFWTNTYNALVLQTVIERSIASSIRERDDFFHAYTYRIGGHECSLDVIEHGILRRNQRKYLGVSPVLSRHDPRLAWKLRQAEPRIHFALYTAAFSSPAPRAFSAQDLDGELEQATRNHLHATVQLRAGEGTLRLPMVFRWYTLDFGRSMNDAIAFTASHLDDESLRTALDDDDLRVEFTPYDWRLNDRYARIATPGQGA